MHCSGSFLQVVGCGLLGLNGHASIKALDHSGVSPVVLRQSGHLVTLLHDSFGLQRALLLALARVPFLEYSWGLEWCPEDYLLVL